MWTNRGKKMNFKNYGPEDEDDDWVEKLDFFDLMDED